MSYIYNDPKYDDPSSELLRSLIKKESDLLFKWPKLTNEEVDFVESIKYLLRDGDNPFHKILDYSPRQLSQMFANQFGFSYRTIQRRLKFFTKIGIVVDRAKQIFDMERYERLYRCAMVFMPAYLNDGRLDVMDRTSDYCFAPIDANEVTEIHQQIVLKH